MDSSNIVEILVCAIAVAAFFLYVFYSYRSRNRMEANLREIAEHAKKELITKMSGSEFTFTINPKDETFTVISRNKYFEKNYPGNETYSQTIKRYIDNDVSELDREMVRKAFSLDTILANLEEEDAEYTVIYRDISMAYAHWFEMRAVRLSEDEILFGLSDRDDEIVNSLIFRQLRENYLAMYYVNLDTDLALSMKDSPLNRMKERSMSYVQMMKEIASYTEGETRDMFEKLSDIGFVRQRFKTVDSAYHTFKSGILGEMKWFTVAGYALERSEDGTPILCGLVFNLLDDLASAKEEANLKYRQTMEELELENQHNIVLNQINKSGPWILKYSKDNEVTGFELSSESRAVFRNDFDGFEEWIDLIHPDDRGRVGAAYDLCLRDVTCKTPYEAEYRFKAGDGTYHWIRSAGRMLRNEDGSGEFYGVCSDIEDIIRTREEQKQQLAEALSMAESSSRAKTTFLNNISHDIRTPMNAIIGYTKLAESRIDDKELVKDYLEKISHSSNHLLSLINDVLDMSRIESGKMNLEEQPENLHEIVDSICDIVDADLQAKHHSFRVYMAGVHDDNIICDKLRLNQVLLNIISNSIKYTPDGGKISMNVAEKEVKSSGYATYEFRIKDNGMGMTEEYLKSIFDVFSRAMSTTVSGIQGTGLGMAITKNIIDMMGGEIDIKSEPGKGTETVITLDFRLDKAAAAPGVKGAVVMGSAKAETPDDDSLFAGKKILLVEDNEFNMEIATEILQEAGFVVDTAEDGSVALEKMRNAQAGDYNLILMDIQMPVMDGYEATRQIHALGTEAAKIPIIAMTANAFEEDRKAAFEAGMDEHIAKPVDIAKMKKVLAKFL